MSASCCRTPSRPSAGSCSTGPYLAAAFKAAGLTANIQNALNDPQKMRSQADNCVSQGAKVALIVALDPGSGLAITKALKAGGAKVIDYDRLTPGSGASYYVSFDNVQVGKLQGLGLVAGLKADGDVRQEARHRRAERRGHGQQRQAVQAGLRLGPEPALQGRHVLKKATAGDQWTNWDPVKGQTIFEGMLARNSNNINGVLAANDGLAGAVVATLKNKGLKPVPLTGQDATPTGLQYILAGWQTGTVYKPVALEANCGSQRRDQAHQGRRGQDERQDQRYAVRAPQAEAGSTRRNYNILFTDKWVKKSAVCVGAYKQYC